MSAAADWQSQPTLIRLRGILSSFNYAEFVRGVLRSVLLEYEATWNLTDKATLRDFLVNLENYRSLNMESSVDVVRKSALTSTAHFLYALSSVCDLELYVRHIYLIELGG